MNQGNTAPTGATRKDAGANAANAYLPPAAYQFPTSTEPGFALNAAQSNTK